MNAVGRGANKNILKPSAYKGNKMSVTWWNKNVIQLLKMEEKL